MQAVPGPPPLRTAVVIDYQNVHLVGHEAFPTSRNLARHESLIDPLLFAQQLIVQRNLAMQPGLREGHLELRMGVPRAPIQRVRPRRQCSQP